MADPQDRYLAYGILQFLDEEFKNPAVSADSRESLEVAMQCLETAFNINIRDEEYRSAKTLREIFREFKIASDQGNTYTAKGSTSSTSTAKPEVKLEDMLSASGLHIDIDNGPVYYSPPDSDAESKREADNLKNLGNEEMKDGKFAEALEHYSLAIGLDGRNSVYFCNRAAAFLKLNLLEKALRDCQVAVQLNPDYARAFGRMGVTYSNMGDHTRAYACYRKAVELEPENESYINNLRVAQEILENAGSTAEAAAGAAAAGGAGAATPNIQTIFNNPSLINMATQMLQDPNMQNMMRSIITGFNTGGSDTQSVDSLLQMGQAIANQIRQSNPNLAEEIGSRLGNPEPRSSPQGDSYDL